MSDLETRLQRLEDIEALRQLKARYARTLDQGLRGDESFPENGFIELFHADAVWEANIHGRHEGRDAIREFFANVTGGVSFALHFMVDPWIEIADDGSTAVGRWYGLETLTIDGRAVWIAGAYTDEFVRSEDGWLITSVTSAIDFIKIGRAHV